MRSLCEAGLRKLVFFALVVFFADRVIDAWISSAAYHHDTFLRLLFHPTLREAVDQLLLLTALLAFMAFAVSLLRKECHSEALLQEAVDALREEKKRTEEVLESLGDAVSIQSPEFRILYQNAAHKALMRYHKGEICYEAFHGRDRPCDGCRLEASFPDEPVQTVERTLSTGEGTQYVEIKSSPLRSLGGDIVAGIESVRDVTERRLAEQAIERLQRQNELILNSAGDGIYGIDAEGRISFVNRTAVRITGWEPEDLVGKMQHPILHHSHSDGTPYHACDCRIYHAMHEGTTVEVDDEVFWRKDGSSFPVHYVSTPILESGHIVGAVIVFSDVTARKRAEENIRRLNADLLRQADELRELNSELESFSYSVSHDLRSPLSRIVAAASLLQEPEDLPSEIVAATSRTIENAGRQMEQIIEAMLALSRLARAELAREEVNLSFLSRSILMELRENDPQRAVETAIAEGMTACGDSSLLELALRNLLANAWKFTSHQERARIEIGRAGEETFYVRDDGAGFDMENAEMLFRPFQRLHTMQQFPGTGIGLATVQRVIARHGGRIWAEGKKGEGAVFYFTLPECEEEGKRHC